MEEKKFEEVESEYLKLKEIYDQQKAEFDRIENEKSIKARNEKIIAEEKERKRQEEYHIVRHISDYWKEIGIEKEDQTLESLWGIIGYKEWANRQGMPYNELERRRVVSAIKNQGGSK